MFPDLTPNFIRKYYVHTAATAMGHLNRTRKNLRSTQPSVPTLTNKPDPPLTPSPSFKLELTPSPAEIHLHIYKPSLTNYSDATGTVLDTGIHFLIMFHYDANYIHATPLSSFSAATYLKAYLEGIAIFTAAHPDLRLVPVYERADNAVNNDFVAHLRKKGIQVQLAPPNNHRANKAERAIQTFKNHFIAGLATCDPQFPITQAKNLTHQCLLTLNLMRKSRLSDATAQVEMHGPFDSNRYDLHPPGCRLVTLDDPSDRRSFAPHGTVAFYLGPAPNHYRSYTVFVPTTSATRVTDSVDWLPFTDIVPKYPTLPPGLFANAATPVQTNPTADVIPTVDVPVPSQHDIINQPFQPTTPPITPVTTPMVPLSTMSPLESEGARSSFPPPPLQPTNLTDTLSSEGAGGPSDGQNDPQSNLAMYVYYQKAIRGPNFYTWQDSMNTEMDRLVNKTKSMSYKPDGIIPPGAKVSTGNPVIKEKLDPLDHSRVTEYRTRMTWGREKEPGDHPTSSSTIDTTAMKLLLNSTVSDHTALLSTIDISDFYLHSQLSTPHYMKIPIRFLPPITRTWLGITNLPDDATLLFEVYNAIYGMDDAGRVSQQNLIEHLRPHGFYMCRHTPGLFRHRQRTRIFFETWVDDFLIKSDPATDDLTHLQTVLALKYPIKFQLKATAYLGYNITLYRHPTDPQLDRLTIQMRDYVQSGLAALNFTATSKPGSPILYTPPSYGNSIQYEAVDDSPPASPEQQTFLRSAVGIFRYYCDAVDPSPLLAISKLAQDQSAPTLNTMVRLDRFLNYMAANPNATIVYKPSDMQLHVHSDESYLSDKKSRSRAAGVSTCGPIVFAGLDQPHSINGLVRCTSTIIPSVVGSATDASYAAMYLNGQCAEVDRQTLLDLGHPQQPTTMTYDNEPAGNIVLRTAKIKKSKAILMKYHWIQDRSEMGHFKVVWGPGPHNLADFPSKAHPIHHYRSMRGLFTVDDNPPNSPHLSDFDERVC